MSTAPAEIIRAVFAAELALDALCPPADDEMGDAILDCRRILSRAIDDARDRFIDAVAGPLAPQSSDASDADYDAHDEAAEDARHSFDWILRTYRRHGDAEAALRLLDMGKQPA